MVHELSDINQNICKKNILAHLVHHSPSIASSDREQGLVMVAEGVHVEQPRCRNQEGEEVAKCHRHEDNVGGRPHVALAQHDHDQGVGQQRDEEQKGHDVAVHEDGVGDGQLARYVHVVGGVTGEIIGEHLQNKRSVTKYY